MRLLKEEGRLKPFGGKGSKGERSCREGILVGKYS